jgi:hypothetical protein
LAVAPPGRFSKSRIVAVLLPSRASFRVLLGAFFFGVAFFPALLLLDATIARRVPATAFWWSSSRTFPFVHWSMSCFAPGR